MADENPPVMTGEQEQGGRAVTPPKERTTADVDGNMEMENVSQDEEEMEVEEEGQAVGVAKEDDKSSVRETDAKTQEVGVAPCAAEGKDGDVSERSGEEDKTKDDKESDGKGAETVSQTTEQEGDGNATPSDEINNNDELENAGVQETTSVSDKKARKAGGAAKRKEKDSGFPDTLAGFNYRFNEGLSWSTNSQHPIVPFSPVHTNL